MKILGVMPARKGSKGIKEKNTKLLNGKPLVCYTLEEALKSKLHKVVVSTDCPKVKSISERYDVEIIDRPSSLSSDNALTLPVLQHVLGQLSEPYDAVMTLQPTSPLRGFRHINEAIELFKSDSSADSLVSVIKAPHNCVPEKIMILNGKYLSGNNDIIRRQDVDEYYVRNGASIYISSIELLRSHIIGKNVLPYLMNKIESLDIDDIEDWNIIEAVMKSLPMIEKKI